MFRYILVAGIVLVSLMTFQLYEVSYNTNDIRSNIRLLKTEISKEKEKINVLRFELSQAKRPENIMRLNDNLLHLKPQKVEQFITMEQMPTKVAILLPEPELELEVVSGIAELLADEQQIIDPIGDLLNQ